MKDRVLQRLELSIECVNTMLKRDREIDRMFKEAEIGGMIAVDASKLNAHHLEMQAKLMRQVFLRKVELGILPPTKRTIIRKKVTA